MIGYLTLEEIDKAIQRAVQKYNPYWLHQPRDWHGRWTEGWLGGFQPPKKPARPIARPQSNGDAADQKSRELAQQIGRDLAIPCEQIQRISSSMDPRIGGGVSNHAVVVREAFLKQLPRIAEWLVNAEKWRRYLEFEPTRQGIPPPELPLILDQIFKEKTEWNPSGVAINLALLLWGGAGLAVRGVGLLSRAGAFISRSTFVTARISLRSTHTALLASAQRSASRLRSIENGIRELLGLDADAEILTRVSNFWTPGAGVARENVVHYVTHLSEAQIQQLAQTNLGRSWLLDMRNLERYQHTAAQIRGQIEIAEGLITAGENLPATAENIAHVARMGAAVSAAGAVLQGADEMQWRRFMDLTRPGPLTRALEENIRTVGRMFDAWKHNAPSYEDEAFILNQVLEHLQRQVSRCP